MSIFRRKIDINLANVDCVNISGVALFLGRSLRVAAHRGVDAHKPKRVVLVEQYLFRVS